MYNPITTEDFDKWITAESRTFEVKCEVIDGADTVVMSGTGQSGDIISMEWNNVICSNDGLQIGTTCMDEFKMTYRNKDGLPSLMNKEIHPYVGLVCPHENTGDVTVWIPLGIFYVTNTETADEDKTFTLTAYDGMQMFMGDFNATAIGVTFPCKAWNLLEAIASHFGVTIDYDAILYNLLSSDDYILTTSDGYTLVVQEEINANRSVSVGDPLEGTYRDYIGWIAGLVGANAHMSRDGNLRIARYTNYGLQIPRTIQHMGGTKINFGGSVSYTNIISGTDENPVYATSYSGNAITYTNPFITTAELDRVCDELIGEDGITVTPCDIAWRSDPRVDAGDIVYAEDKDGNYFPVYVMERVVRITGGLAEDLHCYVETEVQKVLDKSPLVAKITRVARSSEVTPASIINNTVGTFEWINNGDGTNGGFTIYENDNNSWLRCTAGGLGISADGGLTYTNAITKNGIVASKLQVVQNNVNVMMAGANGGHPYFSMRNASNGNLAMSLWGDDITTALYIYNTKSGNNAFQLYSATESQYEGTYSSSFYQRDPNTGNALMATNMSFLTSGDDRSTRFTFKLYDPATTSNPHISMGVGLDASLQNSTYNELMITRDGAGNPAIGFRLSGYGTPNAVLDVYDFANQVQRVLSLRQVTISGINYWIMASV